MSAVIGNRHQAAMNRARAPITGAFTEAMRNAFGNVHIQYVSENGLVLGKPFDDTGKTVIHAGEMALLNCKPEKK